jgi:hypothetical protein
MKTVMEQLIEIQDKLDALKAQAQPEVECDEPETETPQSAITAEEATTIIFTKDELITFATHLVERTLDKCKEAVTDTSLDTGNLVDLSMGYGYEIEVELDTDAITRSIHDEIDGVVETDPVSVNDEINSILNDMDMDYKS